MKTSTFVHNQETLTHQEIQRYSRHLLLPEIGMQGQMRLKSAKILVIGAGGLGSPVLLYLAAAGIGTIGIADDDTVEESNLQRQVIHTQASIGQLKVDSAKTALESLNPLVTVRTHPERILSSNAIELFEQYDLIIDGSDNFATRYLINDACVLSKKPYVWGSIFRFEGQASVFWEQAPMGKGINYRDLYPEPPPPEFAPSCAEGGVLGVLCSAIASIMATEAIKLICSIGKSLLGRLAVYDALDMEYRFIPLQRAPERYSINSLIDYQQFCTATEPSNQEHAPSISTHELMLLKESGKNYYLIDIREQQEVDIVRMEGAQHIPNQGILRPEILQTLDKQHLLILHCKTGGRSKNIVCQLIQRGFNNARNLDGGILAWAKDIDKSLPLY